MTAPSAAIVQKLWSYCYIPLNAGLSETSADLDRGESGGTVAEEIAEDLRTALQQLNSLGEGLRDLQGGFTRGVDA